MKQERNMPVPYPIYPPYQGIMPQFPQMEANYFMNDCSNSSNLDSLESRVSNLEKKVANIENYINNSNSINNNYNSSNYQML